MLRTSGGEELGESRVKTANGVAEVLGVREGDSIVTSGREAGGLLGDVGQGGAGEGERELQCIALSDSREAAQAWRMLSISFFGRGLMPGLGRSWHSRASAGWGPWQWIQRGGQSCK